MQCDYSNDSSLAVFSFGLLFCDVLQNFINVVVFLIPSWPLLIGKGSGTQMLIPST